MRLFVAVDLPPALVSAAAAVADACRERVRAAAPRARVTWVPADRLHLTLRFIGDANPEAVPELVDALAEPFERTAFVATLGRPGVFPPRGSPSVLWLGMERGVAELQQLEHEVSRRLERVGIAGDGRPYRPHVTLGRVRDAAGLRPTALLDGLGVPPASGVIDAITLFESRLSPNGPRYAAIHRSPLRPT